jgi:glucose/arabinose dehydrogenase
MKVPLPRATSFTAAVAVVFALLPSSTTAAQQLQAGFAAAETAISAPAGTTAGNAACPGEDVFYNPSHGEDIVLPEGYKIDVFATGLNFPTGIGFMRTGEEPGDFVVTVVESGTGLPSRCNNNEAPVWGGKLSPTNPFTPDMLVLDRNGKVIRGPLFKPTSADPAKNTGYQPDGPAIGLAFANGNHGKLFVSDSNQGIRGAPGKQNNSSRIMTADLATGTLTRFITGLPTGDHPTENLLVKDGFVYWAQGSATNSGVTGHDNGAGGNQHDIACQNVVLSQTVWDSGDGHMTSGYSNHGVARPGAQVSAFEDATAPGMCTGAILRAKINVAHPEGTIQPFSWGYRNPYVLRFAPKDHALKGGLFAGTDGEDERGARPTSGAPDRLELAEMNPDGTPDYHGWPDRFGFLDASQSVFNPNGGPADDLCGPPAMPVFNAAACAAVIKAKDTPVRHVLAYPPQLPKAPLAIEPADSSMAGIDFVPNSFVHGVIRRGAALVAREGDLGFSAANGQPEEGHDIQLVNFSQPGAPLALQLSRAIFNCPKAHQTHLPNGAAACKQDPNNLASPDITGDQAFADQLRAIDRPTNLMFGPDGALYLVDYGAVRDLGRSDPNSAFTNPADAPLVQIPHTGTIWKITRTDSD